MSPEEKAAALIEKFRDATQEWDELDGWVDNLDRAKEVAELCVDEIMNLSYFTHEPTEDDELYKNYWVQVKEAIQKL